MLYRCGRLLCVFDLSWVHMGGHSGRFVIMRWIVTTNRPHCPMCTHYMGQCSFWLHLNAAHRYHEFEHQWQQDIANLCCRHCYRHWDQNSVFPCVPSRGPFFFCTNHQWLFPNTAAVLDPYTTIVYKAPGITWTEGFQIQHCEQHRKSNLIGDMWLSPIF